MAELILYSRRGCGLCEELLRELLPLLADEDVRVRVVDIDEDRELKRRYGLDIPVLTDGDLEICRHRLDREALDEWLARL